MRKFVKVNRRTYVNLDWVNGIYLNDVENDGKRIYMWWFTIGVGENAEDVISYCFETKEEAERWLKELLGDELITD